MKRYERENPDWIFKYKDVFLLAFSILGCVDLLSCSRSKKSSRGVTWHS